MPARVSPCVKGLEPWHVVQEGVSAFPKPNFVSNNTLPLCASKP
ncbi:hypothetical protein MTBPR1_30244 [Candidatus Terasakiella magnetica]|uniref:Uncharacterized protein n=1 Tax=Candidatus Terasakiella magnetica TaxID=1867952 RepID=A0A1C3RI45_9PROT|nr:hypothetical protein MTBPR1_30244 [Candidatus Terasakiella magnetica]